MLTLSHFTELYKNISNTELLFILENPEEYQPLAVEAAQIEFDRRKLSEKDTLEAKEKIIHQQLQKNKQKEKLATIEKKLTSKGQTLIEILNPVQTGIPTGERIIRFIVVIFSVLIIYHLVFNNFFDVFKYFSDSSLQIFLHFTPYLILIIGLIAFWKRKKIGWYFLAFYLMHISVLGCWSFIEMIRSSMSNEPYYDYFETPSLISFFIALLFHAGCLYAMCTKMVRELYSVNKNDMLATFIISASITIFVLYFISNYY